MAFLQEYTMLDEIGRGGFATVYKVRHNELGYIRAVRVLNDTIVDVDSVAYQKFLRECKVLLRLGNGNHPHIVHIYQPRLLENKALVEMDYVDGMDLTHYLKQNRNFVPVEEVIRMAEQMSSALAYCHEDIYRFCMDRNSDHLQDDPNDGSKVLVDEETRKRLINKYKVIHNDIHSGNIMRREDGSFVLLDFGLAINGNEVVRSSRHANGAPEYKAPEKWDDESILTEQSDIYSFGIVLYHYLAGRVPFPYNTKISAHRAEFELGEAHQKAAPPAIEDLRCSSFEKQSDGQHYVRDYPQWLEDIILKCLAKNPADRFANGQELHGAILAGMAQMRSDDILQLQNECESLKVALQLRESEVATLQSEKSVQAPETSQPQNDPDNTHPKRKTLVWKVIAAVLLLCLLGCIFLLWHARKSEDTTPNTTKKQLSAITSETNSMDSLQRLVDDSQHENDSLRNYINSSYDDKLSVLENAVQRLQNENEALNMIRSAEAKKYASIESETKSLAVENKNLQKSACELQNQIVRLKHDNDNLQHDNDNLQHVIKEMSNEIKALRNN